MTGCEPIFSPRSIAVVGASERPGSVGDSIFKNLLFSGFRGILYPVNPKAKSISGVKAYPSVKDIPESFDLVILIVGPAITMQVLQDAIDKGVKGAVVITAGFKEVGGEGARLEVEIASMVKKAGIRLVGPNCLGVINTDSDTRMNASFATQMPREGNIAFISQSGALCTAVLDFARSNGFGFSKFISIGNKADVNEIDLIRYLHDDPKTDVILLYLEDITDGWEFIKRARQTSEQRKPIIAIKSGTTPQGAKAASSHTGSLAGSDKVYDAIFDQAGIIRVNRIEELFDLAIAFAQQPLPKGRNVAIVTNAGGPGIIATDACIRSGLELATLSDKTVAKLKKHLPPTSNLHNPVDVIGDARSDRYKIALKAVATDENVDGIITILTPQQMTDAENIAHELVTACSETDKPILTTFMGVEDVSAGVKVLEKSGLPHYFFPESAAMALAAMRLYVKWRERPRTEVVEFTDVDKERVAAVMAEMREQKLTHVPEVESVKILEAYGLPVLPFRLVKNVEEALETAEDIGYPVVLKVVSPDIVHKLDVGGVKVGIRNHSDMLEAFIGMKKEIRKKAPKADLWGYNVQKMAPSGQEVIVGMNRDPEFGPVVMFGLGGSMVEALQDVTFRLAPLRKLSSKNMISQIRAHKLLESFRGSPPRDTAAIEEILQRISQLVIDFEEIAELDMNPVIVYEAGHGCMVADASIIINK